MKRILVFSYLVITSLLLVACGLKPTSPSTEPPTAVNSAVPSGPTVTPSATPDLCTQDQMPETVKIVNTYMREFTKYTSLSYQIPSGSLPQVIGPMKTIREGLNQQAVPTCLITMKHEALQYMDAVIQTEVTFVSQPTPEKAAFESGRQQALKHYNAYAIELARLLGVTLAPENATPAAQQQPATPAGAVVFNPGPNPLNLHRAPSLTSESIAMLEAAASAKAIGRSSNGEWIQVEVPGQPGTRAWVYASLVQYTSGNAGVLPVATP